MLGSSKAVQRRKKEQSRATEQSERVLQVLKNLAPRYGEVMQILAQLQLSEMEPLDRSSSQQAPGWVDYKIFRAACKSRFVIDKDSKLRTLQTELSDHHLLVSKHEGSTEYVRIPYNIEKLQEIISYRRNTDL
jgi:Fe2+ or Zn2+ uptake regulation protein